MTAEPCVKPDGQGLAFILSSPRAGSTLLAAVLGSHSQVLCPPEPWFLLPLTKMLDDQLVVVASYDHSLAAQAIAESAPRAVSDDALRAYAGSLYNALLAASSKHIFVDKTPRYYQISDRLSELFPAALQIWLKRNPLDVIASLKSTWGLPIAELVGDHPSPYTFDAIISQGMLADHFEITSGPKIALKYEEFVAKPEGFTRQICELLGIEFEPDMLHYGSNKPLVESYKRAHMGDKKVLAAESPHTASVGRWRGVLAPSEVATCLDALGARVFEDLNYGAAFEEACQYAEVNSGAVAAEGRIPLVREAYDTYAQQVLLSTGVSNNDETGAAGVKYTLLGRQNELLQQEADKRLEVIQRLDADVRILRERAQLADALRAIEAAIASQGDALAQVESAVGRHEVALRQIEIAASKQEATIANIVQTVVGGGPVAVASTETIEAWEAERRALQAAREQAEAAAEARLRVIEEQDRALRRYRRWHPREHLARLIAPRIGQLYQYAPRPMFIPSSYLRIPKLTQTPSISIVTPSLNQGRFIERTIRSVSDQRYPAVEHIIQDACSSDDTMAIIQRHQQTLSHVASEPDSGFADGINRGFRHATGEILAYLNSDDLLLPGSLHYVAKYFVEHPDVDVVYGHRVVIDEYDAEIGRWVLPPHDDEVLSWADYVPQETLFWRRQIWERVGASLDESFRFAIDWDLLIRMRSAGAKMRRLPRFLGAFRVHPHQKTTLQMEEVGRAEMSRLRERCHGREVGPMDIQRGISSYLRKHFYYHKLYRLGVLRY